MKTITYYAVTRDRDGKNAALAGTRVVWLTPLGPFPVHGHPLTHREAQFVTKITSEPTTTHALTTPYRNATITFP